MLGDLFGKLQEAQQKMSESKNRLRSIEIEGDAANGAVKVVVTASREIKSIDISAALMNGERKEELEDLLITALNRALNQAEEAWEKEMKSAAGSMFGL